MSFVILSSCTDEFPGGASAAASSSTGSGGGAGSGGVAESGAGGSGGGPSCADGCGGATPICADESTCVAECPNGRDVCHTSEDAGAPSMCCRSGEQCCEAGLFGYAADLCRPDSEACPLGCPDGKTACPLGEYCSVDLETNVYSCAAECPAARQCNPNVCCPNGAQCVDGACLLPDLTVDATVLEGSITFTFVDSASDECLIGEQCLGGEGSRAVVNFTSRTGNIGATDFVIGDPNGNPDFEWSECHQHFHYYEYAEYRLVDAQSRRVAAGKKQGFAIIDLGAIDPDDPDTPKTAKYGPEYQGIQHGWYDEYWSGLPCQWIDVTGVPPGDYLLEVEVNPVKKIAEADYTNNVAVVPVTIPDPSCFGVDCTALDSECAVGVCVPNQGCVAVNAHEGEACSDGVFCTDGETCHEGLCGGGSPKSCTPPGGCLVGTCDEESATCLMSPGNEGQPCDDGNTCTKDTTCSSGLCKGGAPVNEGLACDDGTACTTGTTCTAGVCGGGTGPTVYFGETFSNGPGGWTLGPEWEIGPAMASTGADLGGDDPSTDHSPSADNGLAGVVIGGTAALTLHDSAYLVSPPFDTSTAAGSVVLGYYRWLDSDVAPWMNNTIDVWNGSAWVTIWTDEGVVDNPAGGGSGWTYQSFDVTSYKNAAMQVRFGFEVGELMGLYNMGSWNVDDVLVASEACP